MSIPDHQERPRDADESDRNFVVAVGRAFDLLRCWTPATQLLGVSELSRISGLPKSTVSRLTYTLELLGYLRRVPPSGRYALAWGVVSLGYPLLTASTIRQRARPHMQRLSQQLRANTNLGTLDGLHVLYVESVRYDESSEARPDIGLRYPLLSSMLGRTLLASLTGDREERMRNRLSVLDPRAFAAAWPSVERARRGVRGQGYSLAPSELHPGFRILVVPLRCAGDDEPMVLGCTLPREQYTDAQIRDEIGPLAVSVARLIDSESPEGRGA